MRPLTWRTILSYVAGLLILGIPVQAQGTRLLRHASLGANQIVFTYGSDVWIADRDGQNVRRITSTPAFEGFPVLSPDGKQIAFTSDRDGASAAYVVSVEGGIPKRLTWHPSGAIVRGWTPDGQILYASGRETAPKPYNRLWKISAMGGNPVLINHQWATSGSYSPDGQQMIIDRMSRWDQEWRAYRGGQNTPLIILNLANNEEVLLPNEKTTDVQPYWMGDKIYFLSDRDWVMNIWAYTPSTKALEQITEFKGSDIKWLSGHGEDLLYERDGLLHMFDPGTKKSTQIEINVKGDFPWAAPQWEDVSRSVNNVSLSPKGKRAVMSSRGEIFTVPMEHGSPRNLTLTSDAADRKPMWSPKGDKIAWFSESHPDGYFLTVAGQDGMGERKKIDIGSAHMVWEPKWSPDGRYIAFVDDDVQVTVLDLEKESVQIIDTAGTNLERGGMGLNWSPDSKWLAYARGSSNGFGQIRVWSVADDKVRSVTDPFADASSPAWDEDHEHLYFLASTDVALGSGWSNTSAMTARPNYAAYVINLKADSPSPFALRSDEEEGKKDKPEPEGEEAPEADKKKKKKKGEDDKKDEAGPKKDKKEKQVKIDFENLNRRTIALPMPVRRYRQIIAGLPGTVFIVESVPNTFGATLHKFSMKERKADVYAEGVRSFTVSGDKKKALLRKGPGWQVVETMKPAKAGKPLKINLQMKVDRQAEWHQIFHEAWRYERDFFYDPNTHGRDWDAVYERYAPQIPHVRHRGDLTYILDQMNGELSVGHSFVGGGDFPDRERNRIGLLGADFKANGGRWQITRIYTTETWNPNLTSPLDQPGVD
ncbi:MAG: PDZ domain-containing protein, partial [Bacteroidota bacterium]